MEVGGSYLGASGQPTATLRVLTTSPVPSRTVTNTRRTFEEPRSVTARLSDRGGALWRRRFVLRRRLLGPVEPFGAPVFIVGCGHSGTTLLLAVLSQHPALHAIPYESSLMTRSPGDTDWFVDQFNRQARRAGKTAWVEKTPSHVRHIGRLLRRFPQGRVIVVVRDGRDVACSIEARTGDFASGAQRWEDDNAAADEWADHDRVSFLKYEELIEDRESALRSLCDFLDLSFDERLLDDDRADFTFLGRFQDHQRFAREIRQSGTQGPVTPAGAGHRRYRSWQASQPVFDGRGRWRSDLTDEHREIFKAVAGPRLVAYGYEADGDW